MTEKQKQDIMEKRMTGMGYRSIAAEVGLTRDVVRNYCISQGVAGFAKDLVEKDRCPVCGREFAQPTTGRRRRFCSATCRRQYWKDHADELKTIKYHCVCTYCGKIFRDKNLEKKYCSHDCYVRDRFYRVEDMEEFTEKLFDGEPIGHLPGWMFEPLKEAVHEQEEIRKRVAKMNAELED